MKHSGALLEPPVRPMTATPAPALPDPDRAARFAFEAKFDGWRCLAFRTADGVILQSRQQRPLTRYFPEVAAALAEHRSRCATGLTRRSPGSPRRVTEKDAYRETTR